MAKKNGSRGSGPIVINYEELGTISIDEMIHALIEDMKALQDIYNVQYVTGSKLKIRATNEYGEEIRVVRPAGGSIKYMDTHHYRPACKDYDL